MKTTFSLKTTFALLFALATFVFQAPAAEKTEAAAIAALSDKNADKVAMAMQEIEKKFPTSVEGIAKIKSMLTDDREKVRSKAARVLGVLHADLTEEQLKSVAAMLNGKTDKEIMEALKALRGLKSKPVIPQITALLNHKTPNVVRDACRTLSEIGGKDLIPAIEPLLNHANAAVKKDAQDAIFKLKNK